ncbi:hypothetical protein [Streptomyces mirabilis]
MYHLTRQLRTVATNARPNASSSFTTGVPFQRPRKPGLFGRFGPAEVWLNGKRLSVTLGSPDGVSLVLEGPWDAPYTARLIALVLRELTDAEQFAGEAVAQLPLGPWRVCSDQYHPDAALIMPGSRRPAPEDPLGAASPALCATSGAGYRPLGRTGTPRN